MLATSSRFRDSRLGRRVLVLGLLFLIVGGVLIAVDPPNLSSSGATSALTLSLTTSASGATCDNTTNSIGPVCSGLAAGDVINVSGGGFTPGSTASIVECSSVATQPVLAPYPVSCSSLSPTTIPSSGADTGNLSGTFTIKIGTVGPPETDDPPSCQSTVGWPTTFDVTIANCASSGSAATDAAEYPCPPTAGQQAAGYVCTLGIMDSADERVVGAALFGSETLPLCTSVVATTYPTFPCGTTSSTSSTNTLATTTSSSPTTTTTAPVVAPTTLTSSLSGGGQSSMIIVTQSGTPVIDQVALHGSNTSSAQGTVTYTVFSLFFSSDFPFWGWKPAANSQTVAVANGVVPSSSPVTFGPGVYLWATFYSGDALNGARLSQWGSELEIVVPLSLPAS